AGEKKGLFGGWRKKPQETAKPEAESAAPEAPQDALTAEADTTADAAIAPAEPAVEAQPRSQPEPVAEPAPAPAAEPEHEPEPEAAPAAPAEPPRTDKIGFFTRLKQGLSKTSASLGEGMASLFLGKKAIDDDLLDELETRLLTA